MSTATIVNIALTGVVGLFVLVGAIVGAVRGVKKTLVRGVWLGIWTVILVLFLSGIITNLIMNIKFTANVGGVECTGIKEIVTELIMASGVDMSSLGENADAVIQVIVGYTDIILNSVVFVLLFWLLKWLLLPINALIYRVLPWGKAERKYKKEKKAYDKYVKEYKKLHKGEIPVEAMGFADLSDDEKILAGKISEIKQKTALDSLREARASIENNEKIIKNEKLGLDIDKSAVVQENIKEENNKTEETFIPKEEYQPKQEEVVDLTPVTKPKKLKKHRLLGMLVGGVMGIFIGAITLSPALGILSLANDINSNNEIELEDGTKKGLVDYLTQDMFSQINEYYEDSIGSKALTYTGGEWVATATFGALTRGKVDGQVADLAEDAKNIVAIASLVNTITDQVKELEESNYQPDVLRKIIKNIDKIIDYAFNISVVNVLAPYTMQILADEIEKTANDNTTALAENENSTEANDDINKILVKFAQTVATFEDASTIKSELKSFIKIVEMLNYGVNINTIDGVRSTSLLSEILKSSDNSKNSEVTRTIQKLNYEYYTTNQKMYFTSLIEKCYSVDGYETKAVPEVMPMGIEVVLKALLQEAGVTNAGEILAGDSKETVKNFLMSTFNEVFAVLLELNTGYDANNNMVYIEYETEDDWGNITLGKISKNMFTSLGKILDNIAGLVNEEVYKDAIASVAKNLNNIATEGLKEMMGEDPASKVGANLESALNALTGEGAFAKELTAVGEVYQTIFNNNGLFKGEFALNDKDNWQWQINNLSALGNALDALQETTLLGYVNTGDKYNTINIIFTAMLDKVKTDMVDTNSLSLDLNGYIESPSVMEHAVYNIINLINYNISNQCINGKVDWSNTFDKCAKAIGVITDIINAEKTDDVDSIDMVLEILGKHTSIELDGNANEVIKGALDEINITSNTIFTGLVSRVLTDFRSVLNSQISAADNKQVNTIINALFDTLSGVGTSTKPRNTYQYHLNTLKEVYDYITNEEYGLGGLDNIEFDTKDLGKLGELLNIITKSNSNETDAIPLVSNSTICEIIADIMQEQLIDGSNGIESMISDSDISGAMKDFVTTLIANIRNSVPFRYTPTNGWVGVTEALSYIINNCLDGGNIDFADTDATSTIIGKMMDVLSGKDFVIGTGADAKTYNAKFVEPKDVKLLLGKIIAKKMSNMSIDAKIKDAIMGATFSLASDTTYNIYAKAINLYVYGEAETTKDIFNDNKVSLVNVEGQTYTLNGICDKIFNFNNNAYSWEVALKTLLNLTNTNFASAGLGNFSNINHTYYSADTVEISGFGETLDNILINQWEMAESVNIITLDQIKYIMSSTIANELEDVTDTDVRGALDTIVNNINKITESEVKATLKTVANDWTGAYFDTQTKAMQYAIDILNGYTSATDQDAYIADLGVYLDEIDKVVLTNGLGKTFTITILNKIGNDEDSDSIATTINTAVAKLRGEESVTKVFLQNNNDRVNNLYNGKNNEEVYALLSELKSTLNGITFSNFELTLGGETTISSDKYNEMRNNLVNISITIQQLQSNPIVGAKDARYIAIAVINKLVTSMDNLITSVNYSNNVNRAYGHKTGTTADGYKQYLIDRIAVTDEEEEYATLVAGSTTDYEVPYYVDNNGDSNVETAEYAYLYQTQKYIIVYLLDDYYNLITKSN